MDCSRSLRSIIIFSFVLMVNRMHSQYGNEWINYGQQYWKFPVTEKGIHRIGFETLAASGIQINSGNVQNLQLFARENEQYISVVDGGDGNFGPGDYIEFYARPNDGWLDSLIFTSPQFIANPDYSLFNDTIDYFLTIAATPGLRTAVSTSELFSNYPAQSYGWATVVKGFRDQYLPGRKDANGISLPWYDAGEGYFSPTIPKGNALETDIAIPHLYQGSDAPDLVVRSICTGNSMANGFPNHHLQIGWGSSFNLSIDTTYFGYQLNKFSFLIPAASINGTARIVHRTIDDIGVAIDNHAVSWISVDYPKTINASFDTDAELLLQNDGSGFARLSLNSTTAAPPRIFVIIESALREIQVFAGSGTWEALVPFDGFQRRRVLIAVNNPNTVASVRPVSPTGFFTAYTQMPMQESLVMITHPILWNAASNYAAYRENQGTSCLMANVEELYSQYGGGIRRHPLAIRRFCNEILQTWPSKPKGLFIIGKSIHEMPESGETGARNDPDEYRRNLVPTYGMPASDHCFTSGLAQTQVSDAIPTGRLAANSPEQVLDYLNKIVQMESQNPAAWQKRIIHFGGGSIYWEQQLFANYLNGYKAIAQDTSYAASVSTFLKSTTDPIQMNLSDSIQYLINNGVALMTFFGHASSTGFDQNIDSPESYSNQGKYPMLIGNSCYTGNIHLAEGSSTSEVFTLAPNRGVIAFLAKSDLGIPTYLDLFTRSFYDHIFRTSYGKTVGECMTQAVRNFEDPSDFYKVNQALTLGLHGDPLLRLYAWDKPDYSIDASSVQFIPSQISAQIDSFSVRVIVQNIGKAIQSTVGVDLIRHYPNGVDSVYHQEARNIYNSDTLIFRLPIDPLQGTGENLFDVFVDYPMNIVAELDDASNNIVSSKPLVITSGELIPVLPYNFAVIPENQVVLKASTSYALEGMRNYIIQIDTSAAFQSPWMQTHHLQSSGGVITWPLPFALEDSTVYFWRCSRDSVSPEQGFEWRSSSFQYIAGKTGWGQSHFDQFAADQALRLNYRAQQRRWDFDTTSVQLKCEVYGNASTNFEALGTRYQLDLEVQEYSGYGFTPAIMVAVIDSSTLLPWQSNYNGTNPANDFGNSMLSANARHRPEKYFIFMQDDPAQMDALAAMLQNDIPNGNYLLVYSWQFGTHANWPQSLFDAFSSLGSSAVAASPDSLPFIFFTRKGYPASVQEVVGASTNSYISLTAPLSSVNGFGTLISVPIGPASSWTDALWHFDVVDLTPGDSVSMEVHGFSASMADQALLNSDTWPNGSLSLDDLNTLDDLLQIRLVAQLKDQINLSAPQLKSWHVLNSPVPECALNPARAFYLSNDTVTRGQPLKLCVAIENISNIDMDSLLVRYRIENGGGYSDLAYSRQAPLTAGAVLIDTVVFDTRNWSDRAMIFVEANPRINNGNYDQPEQTHFNNILQLPVVVNEDKINPLLEVTFDGMHLLDNEIVSPKPEVVFSIRDDNRYLLLNQLADTAKFRIFLSSPDGSQRQLFYTADSLEWRAAQGSTNRCQLTWKPNFKMDGKYTLLVQGSDVSGNSAGRDDYKINFQVDTRPSITEVLNYPNPFSTRTRFVFTLTGKEVPDEMKIQIMTITGHVVREIMGYELGPLRIGRNLTEYWWDGKDEFGDPLANGVYLYRVIARTAGEELEVRETDASAYFHKGIGKMYLIR